MAKYCYHTVCDSPEGTCGNEIEGMYDAYCLKHMNQYPCTECNHTSTEHEDPDTQHWENCQKCDCKGYKGELE